MRAIPASVYNVAAQLIAGEEAVDAHRHPRARIWLTAAGSCCARQGSLPASKSQARPHPARHPLVITIEEPSAAERLELHGRAFGLSAREHELLGLLAIGSDTRSMARQMSLSEHTAQDHLKSIFIKTGARDRVAVLSRALGTRHEANG